VHVRTFERSTVVAVNVADAAFVPVCFSHAPATDAATSATTAMRSRNRRIAT
jgi:hypothetical protein